MRTLAVAGILLTGCFASHERDPFAGADVGPPPTEGFVLDRCTGACTRLSECDVADIREDCVANCLDVRERLDAPACVALFPALAECIVTGTCADFPTDVIRDSPRCGDTARSYRSSCVP